MNLKNINMVMLPPHNGSVSICVGLKTEILTMASTKLCELITLVAHPLAPSSISSLVNFSASLLTTLTHVRDICSLL